MPPLTKPKLLFFLHLCKVKVKVKLGYIIVRSKAYLKA